MTKFLHTWVDDQLSAARMLMHEPLRRREAALFPLPGCPETHLDVLAQAAREDPRIVVLPPIVVGAPYANFNAMTAIVVRFEPVLFTDDGRYCAKGMQDMEKVWLPLKRDACSGFAFDVKERIRRLDPEQFAAEQFETERARLNYDQRFRYFVEMIAGRRASEEQPSPMFVLPLEQPGSRPERTQAIADALEYLSCPRLCAAIVGDLAAEAIVATRNRT